MKKLVYPVLFLSVLFTAPAVCTADDAEVLKRLDEISQDQQRILQSLEEVKSELQIVKVRSTR